MKGGEIILKLLIPESCTKYLLRLEAPCYDTWGKIQVISPNNFIFLRISLLAVNKN